MVADESLWNKITRIVNRLLWLWEMRSAQQTRRLKPQLHKLSSQQRGTKDGILKSDLVTVNSQLTTVN